MVMIKEAYVKGTNRKIKVEAVEKEGFQEQIFSCVYCGIDLKYIECTTRKDGTPISGHFKIRSHSKPHKEYCVYDVLSELKRIANESDGALKLINEKTYKFNIGIPLASIKPQNNHTKKSSESYATNKVRSKATDNNANIRTLRKLMALRAILNDQKELSQMITLECKGVIINWSDFYYERDRYDKCFQKHKGNNGYPICIQGTFELKDLREKYGYSILEFHSSFLPKNNTDEVLRKPTVSYTIYDQKIVDIIKEKQEQGKKEIVVYSAIRCQSKFVNNKKPLEYLNVYGTIDHRNQFIFI
ncbi:hypothetical protein [Bacillus sp. FJAT-42315]|uniref:hypothetical protein n=1 Tax=Bacillus sp. FJAT-42315 TaxID=2014077 RepID=UPI000C247C6B|nr:hypothetical protein [Bacillus sp. FJAT-42315]